jgi:RND family efflux transporter MFP subunit
MKMPTYNLSKLRSWISSSIHAVALFIKRLITNFSKLEKRIQMFCFFILLVIVLGISVRIYNYYQAKARSEYFSIQLVSTINPLIGGEDSVLSFPGRLDPYLNAPIYARVNGYMRKWYKDIGSPVKSGELLGQIESPDVDQQLQQAKSDLIAAKGKEDFALISYQRWKNLVSADAVSKQEVDQKRTEYETNKSLRQIAEANLVKAKTFFDYKNIPAPFDGLITERNTDVGDLVIASGGKALFTVVNIDKLRLYVNIPQVFKNDIHEGLAAKITVPEYPGKIFEAKVVRSAGAVNPISGAVLIEIEVENKDHELSSGEYAQVAINLPSDKAIPRIPASALMIRGDGDYLAVVSPDQTIALVKVTIGRDFGQQVEVIGDVSPDMRVVDNPPEDLKVGQKVKIVNDPKEKIVKQSESKGQLKP